jgi:hypothetical protein
MSVVSGGRTIFCEGRQSSLDYKLLSKLVEDISGDKCTIIPAGSKFTFSIFAQGYFFPDELKNQRFIVFRDRDFDAKPASNIQLITLGHKSGNQSFTLTYRSCIENYLLDASLIDQYWQEKHQEKTDNPASKWGHGDSPGISVIKDWLKSSAEEIRFYQAVRWALGDLLIEGMARDQLKTTWTSGSGTLPDGLDLQSCQDRALELVYQFKQVIESITAEKFTVNLEKYHQQFSQEGFWLENDYLIWFHGKDIQKAMQKKMPSYISLTSFFNWAVDHLDIAQHPDLMELKTKIQQL